MRLFYTSIAGLLLLSSALNAQDEVEFRLFEEVEESSTQQPQQRVRRQNNERNNPTQPEFTLVGTSRIGSRYSAILQHRSGEAVYIKSVNSDGNTRVPGYRDFTIVDVGAGAVSLRYPDDNPCIDFEARGVRCNSAVNIAALSLANGEPLPGRVFTDAAAASEDRDEEDASADAGEETTPVNPFEALRQARENGTAPQLNDADADADGGGNRFVPRRIAPEDVPPGMRVVSTPFGDRLVEQ